jgi:hypothetical protein
VNDADAAVKQRDRRSAEGEVRVGVVGLDPARQPGGLGRGADSAALAQRACAQQRWHRRARAARTDHEPA